MKEPPSPLLVSRFLTYTWPTWVIQSLIGPITHAGAVMGLICLLNISAYVCVWIWFYKVKSNYLRMLNTLIKFIAWIPWSRLYNCASFPHISYFLASFLLQAADTPSCDFSSLLLQTVDTSLLWLLSLLLQTVDTSLLWLLSLLLQTVDTSLLWLLSLLLQTVDTSFLWLLSLLLQTVDASLLWLLSLLLQTVDTSL